MLELSGKYNTAKVFTDNVDSATISQVINLLNMPYMADSQIRIMPDCHAGIGKGNPDWNYSAPHGAGRILSRSQAKDLVDFDEFKESMQGIYSSSVVESTIDESPMAYKQMDEIMANIKDTVDIVDVIKPIYNFKAH